MDANPYEQARAEKIALNKQRLNVCQAAVANYKEACGHSGQRSGRVARKPRTACPAQPSDRNTRSFTSRMNELRLFVQKALINFPTAQSAVATVADALQESEVLLEHVSGLEPSFWTDLNAWLEKQSLPPLKAGHRAALVSHAQLGAKAMAGTAPVSMQAVAGESDKQVPPQHCRWQQSVVHISCG